MPVPTATLLLRREGGVATAGDGPWMDSFPSHLASAIKRHPPHPPFLIPRALLAAPCRAVPSPLSVLLRLPAAAAAHAVISGMRVGDGGESEERPRGGGAAVRRKCGAVVEDGEASGCSASSTSRGSSARGSSGGDSPLTRFVRRGGRLGTDPERDETLTSSSSYASAGSTEPQEEEDDAALEAAKDKRWVHARPQGQTKNAAAVPCLTGERQDQRHRLGSLLFQGRKDRAQRPASLDFGCPGPGVARSSMPHSPGFPVTGVGVMNKGLGISNSSHGGRPDVLSSPGTPSYDRRGMAGVGYQQGPISERVMIPPSDGHRRHPGSGMVLPYSSGRTLPSKWEDAERWIFSPNPNNALGRSIPQLWRPKSKSGPVGPPGRFGGAYSCVSSSAQFLDNARVGNLTVNAPYLAGVLLPEHVCGGVMDLGRDLSGASGDDSSNGRGGRPGQMNGRHPAMQSTRVSQQLGSAVESYQSLPTSLESIQDGGIESIKDSATSSAPIIVRKDVATQTSPDISRSSSPSMRSSFSRSLSAQQVKELESCFSKLEVRDVQVDDRVTLTRWSKKHVTRGSDKNAPNIIEWKKKTMDSKSSDWEVTETTKCISKIEGEETKMTAWENMQKVEAEATIQKLVIKLEKKRPYSLGRIFNTLRSGSWKTQVVRSTSTVNQDQHISRTIKTVPHLSKNGQMSSLSGCFTCHAF